MPFSPQQLAYLSDLDALPMGHEKRMRFFHLVQEWDRRFSGVVFGFGIHEFDVHRAMLWALERLGIR